MAKKKQYKPPSKADRKKWIDIQIANHQKAIERLEKEKAKMK